MDKITDQARRRQRRTRTPMGMRATIRTNATTEDQPVYVTIDRQSPTVKRGPCYGWELRGERLPENGDSCAVIELDDETLWIVAWKPED